VKDLKPLGVSGEGAESVRRRQVELGPEEGRNSMKIPYIDIKGGGKRRGKKQVLCESQAWAKKKDFSDRR